MASLAPITSKLPFYHFRLSIVIAIAQGQFSRAWSGRKPQIFLWNHDIYDRNCRDINISGFFGHIATFGYRSLSQSLGDTFIALDMVENAGSAVGISNTGAICHPSLILEIQVFPVSAATSLFPVVGCRCHHLSTLRSLYDRKSQTCRWNFNSLS